MERGRSTEVITGIVLGSWKPETWNGGVAPAVESLQSLGIQVLTPRDLKISDVSLADNPDFFFLEADLKEAGLKPEDVHGLTYAEAAKKLDFRRLEKLLLKNLLRQGASGLTYVVAQDGRQGKSTSYELMIAALSSNKLALSNPIQNISNEVQPSAKDFLEQVLPQLPIIAVQDIQTYEKKALADHFVAPTLQIRRSQKSELLRLSLQTLLRKKYAINQRPENEYARISTRRSS